MKRIFLMLSLMAATFVTQAQNVGIGTLTPHASAQLDINSTSKGLLPPRMTTAQRNAIAAPSPGLMIFNTTTQALEVFTAYGWYGIQMNLSKKLYGGANYEEPYCIEQTTDGGYVFVANSKSSISGDVTGVNHGQEDIWIVKLDANRNISWNKLIGGSGIENASSIRQTTDGGYILSGNSTSSANGDVTQINHGSKDYWIVKLNANGDIEWNKLLGGNGLEEVGSIRQTLDGGYIVAGSSLSSANGDVTEDSHGLYDCWIVRLDGSGNIIWNRLLGGNSNENAYDIVTNADGTFVFTGYTRSSANGDVSQVNHGGTIPIEVWVVKLSAGGNILWDKIFGGVGQEMAFSIHPLNNEEYILAGYTTSSANGDVTGVNQGSNDCWILKLNRFGDLMWNKSLGGVGGERAYSIKSTIDNGFVFAGTTNTTFNGDVTGISNGSEDFWIVKLDASGNIIWNKLIGGNEAESANSIFQHSDGSLIIAGYTYSSRSGDVGANHGIADVWVVKLSAEGQIF